MGRTHEIVEKLGQHFAERFKGRRLVKGDQSYNTEVFLQRLCLWGKADLSTTYWNLNRKMRLTKHFSATITKKALKYKECMAAFSF